MEFLYWYSIFMIFYAYFGYPICLLLILGIRHMKARITHKDLVHGRTIQAKPLNDQLKQGASEMPSVSFIITAYNEELRIRKKLENSLALEYPREKLEIIVASDCSEDLTDQIVEEYKSTGIKLVRAPERKGKENAQKYAVQQAIGDILVFSDVATILKPDAIMIITRNFKDLSVGCVSSTDHFIEDGERASGEGLYVKYEMFLRMLESKAFTLVGLSGSFFAARKEVCREWSTDLQSDFNTLLNSIKLGMRGVIDPASIGYYVNIVDEHKEFNRKVRTVLRGLTVLMRNLKLMNPSKYGIFAWELFSHKLCRWLVPYFLIFAFISNAMLLFHSGLLALFFLFQVGLYMLSFYYFLATKRKIHNHTIAAGKNMVLMRMGRVPYYFVSVNLSIMIAWIKYIRGERTTFWEPSKRRLFTGR